MLWRYELKKILVTQKGLMILTVCLLLKLILLCVFPEQKDSRILLSQKQYDKYLAQLYGENTQEKSDWILAEYESCKQLQDMQESMQAQYSQGSLTDEEWKAYTEALQLAELHINSAQIFAEKAEQFSQQPEDIPPAHYIYEYGWQTIYTLLQFPDIFLLFGLLLLIAQCFPAEAAGGMLPVLMAARNGRRQLYFAKLLALVTVCLTVTVLSCGLEAGVFLHRGWCNDSGAPLYSVTRMAKCPLKLTLLDGYLLCLLARALATLLFTVMAFGLSVWLKSTTNLIFSGLCILALPMLWGGTLALFTHGGLLCGSQMLLWLGSSGLPLPISPSVIAAYSAAIAFLAGKRHQRWLC